MLHRTLPRIAAHFQNADKWWAHCFLLQAR
jgi:hypothetical protein